MHQMRISTIIVASVMLDAKIFENSKSYFTGKELLSQKRQNVISEGWLRNQIFASYFLISQYFQKSNNCVIMILST